MVARETIPVADSKRIQPGDVGFLREGRFHLLFFAGSSPDSVTPGKNVPRSFQPLAVGNIVRNSHLTGGHLNTETVDVVVSSPSYVHSVTFVVFGISGHNSRATGSAPCTVYGFKLREEKGAVLVTEHPIYREDAEQLGEFEEYMKKHYDSWVKFAKRQLRKVDIGPVLVTGVYRTRDFAMLCYSRSKVDGPVDCDFTSTGDIGSGTWKKQGWVHTNHGPQSASPLGGDDPKSKPNTGSSSTSNPESSSASNLESSSALNPESSSASNPESSPGPDLGSNSGSSPASNPESSSAPNPESSSASNPESNPDQYVFIRYFYKKKRFLVKKIRARAGPHELGGYGGDGSPLEALCGLDEDSDPATSSDTESDTVVHNVRTVRYLSCRPLTHSD